MNPALNKKVVEVIAPQAIVDNTSWTCNVVDTIGYDYAEFVISFGAMDIAMVALKLQESDVAASGTALTNGADVTGAVYGTSLNDAGSTSALPVGTSDNTKFSIAVDVRKRKRYLLLVATGGDGSAGTYATAECYLSRAKEGPRTALLCGFAQRLIP